MIRKAITHLIDRMARGERTTRFLEATLLPAARHFSRRRWQAASHVNGTLSEVRKALETDPVVRRGPFAGMRYPIAKSTGSVFYAKVLGSYEQELHAHLERLLRKGYDRVVDVGCAEGYYAVGLALRLPGAEIHAFDINPKARELCRKMAVENGAADRVQVHGECGPEKLQSLLSSRTLVICDCEGYERRLFTPETLQSLRGTDVLVEMHDFIDIETSSSLGAAFAPTHHVSVVYSTDDIQKSKHYHLPELSGLGLAERRLLVEEGRPGIMEWGIFEAK